MLTRASVGRRLANGVDVAVSGTYAAERRREAALLPGVRHAGDQQRHRRGLDGERSGQFYGQLRFKNFTFTGAYGRRQRDVPTASFGTLFNEQQSREQTTDRHTLADVEYATIDWRQSCRASRLVRSVLVRRHLSVRAASKTTPGPGRAQQRARHQVDGVAPG